MNRVIAGYPVGSYAVKRQQAFTKLDFIKTRLAFKTLVLVALMVFLSLFYIWSRVQIVTSSYQINELKIEQGGLKNLNKRLQIELSLLKSPTRLEKFAEDSGQMRLPTQSQIIEME